jgi:hypothetical protein
MADDARVEDETGPRRVEMPAETDRPPGLARCRHPTDQVDARAAGERVRERSEAQVGLEGGYGKASRRKQVAEPLASSLENPAGERKGHDRAVRNAEARVAVKSLTPGSHPAPTQPILEQHGGPSFARRAWTARSDVACEALDQLDRLVDAVRTRAHTRTLFRRTTKTSRPGGRLVDLKTGGDLLSQALSSQVPSALRGLTSLFGMGRGVSPSL